MYTGKKVFKMQTKRRLCVLVFYLVTNILKTSALTKKRQFFRDPQFDGHSCTSGDIVKTFNKIESGIACIVSCMDSGCKNVFYFPKLSMCQGCYTLYSNDIQPSTSSEISLNYKPVAECPVSFVKYNASCYMVTGSKMTWNSSKEYCASVNAHLAEIEYMEENSFIGNYLEAEGLASPNGRIFFGLTDSQEEAKWLTVHGDIQSFMHWTPGQPDENLSVNQDCGTINMGTASKTWNDVPCSYKLFAVCETELI